MIKNGTRFQSQVCDTQVIVVKAADSLDDLRCGGQPMVPLGADRPAGLTLDPNFADGTAMGKRFVDAGDPFKTEAEIFCLYGHEILIAIRPCRSNHRASLVTKSISHCKQDPVQGKF